MGREIIDEIKNNVKISDLLSSKYTKIIDCPCCNRVKKASVINNEFIYCYSASCGFKADVIGFNSYLLYGTTDNYKDSIKDLISRFNIKTYIKDNDQDLFYKQVNSIYIDKLKDKSLEYLLNRKLNLDIINNIGIGYANGNTLRSEFNRSELIKYGLFKDGKEFFINRITFPLLNNSGHITSFVGRYLGQPMSNVPRYKNLETSINTLILEQYIDLYNSNNLLCIAEGFIDTISLYQLGLQTVGILGVHGLINYSTRLSKFKDICFCFDSDKDKNNNYKSYNQLIPQIIDLILLNPKTNYYIYLPKEAKDINDLLCKEIITKSIVEQNKIPFINFLLDLYLEDYSKHIKLIKLIEAINDIKSREIFYNLIGKTTYNYVVNILDFYGKSY